MHRRFGLLVVAPNRIHSHRCCALSRCVFFWCRGRITDEQISLLECNADGRPIGSLDRVFFRMTSTASANIMPACSEQRRWRHTQFNDEMGKLTSAAHLPPSAVLWHVGLGKLHDCWLMGNPQNKRFGVKINVEAWRAESNRAIVICQSALANTWSLLLQCLAYTSRDS